MSVTTKMWRTLVRVVTVNDYKDEVGVVVPGWDSNKTINIPMHKFPSEIKKLLAKDFRCFAKVNIGAENWRDLKFEDWEYNGTVHTQKEEIAEFQDKQTIYNWPKGKSRFEHLDDIDNES